MEELMILDTLEQIKAISNPYRMDIIKSFARSLDQPWSIKMIAEELGETPSKLHYHIKELEKCGILNVADTREVNGIIEKFYLPAAKRIVIEKDLTNTTEWKAEARRMVDDMLDDAKTKMAHNSHIIQSILYLHPDRLEEFEEKYNQLLEEYSHPAEPDVQPFEAMLLYFPQQKKIKGGK